MTLEEQFERAQQRVKTLTSMPSNDDLLTLYAFYKQATRGDAEGKRPGMFDLKARAKYDAWASRRGLTRDDAMRAYLGLVDRLCGPAA